MSKTVLIMAGGTGGHVIPALTVAKAFTEKNYQVHWLGTPRGIENTLVPAAGYPLHHIQMTGLRGKSKLSLLFAPFKIIKAIWQARKIIRKLKPDVVIGMGGYASAPGGVAAKLLGIKLVIHDQNSVAGMTNRLLARFADNVLQAFPGTFSAKFTPITVGNPVRADIAKLPNYAERVNGYSGQLRLLIMGGSQGAQVFNQAIPQALAQIDETLRPEIWHIAGEKKLAEAKAAYQQAGIKARVDGFVNDMASAYAWADLMIARAGALTVAEITAAGIPSILVPYPYAADDHQRKNAEQLQKAGAAVMLAQTKLDSKTLVDILVPLAQDRTQLLHMAAGAASFAKADAAQEIFIISTQ